MIDVNDEAAVNAALDDALAIRVDAHRRRSVGADGRRGGMSIHEYIVTLEWVRWRESRLEPLRRQRGYRFSRAGEVSTVRSDGYVRAHEAR